MKNIEGPRGCRPDEFEETVDLLNRVFRLPEGRPPGMRDDYSFFLDRSNVDNLRIIKADGRVISHVGIWPTDVRCEESILKVGGIGSVATDPDHRRKGYAQMLLEDSIRKMKDQGYDLSILWTDIDDYYRKFGWEQAGRRYIYYVDRGNVRLFPGLGVCDAKNGPLREDSLTQIKELHDKDRLGVIRDMKLTSTILELSKHDLHLALRESRVAGYIVTKKEKGKDKSHLVAEYGGDARCVLGLVNHLFQKMEPRSLKILTPSKDDDVPEALDRLSLPKALDYVGMLKIIDPKRLLQKLGISHIFAGQEENRVRLRWNETEEEFEQRELVKLIFGPEKVSDFGGHLFPLRFHWWESDRM